MIPSVYPYLAPLSWIQPFFFSLPPSVCLRYSSLLDSTFFFLFFLPPPLSTPLVSSLPKISISTSLPPPSFSSPHPKPKPIKTAPLVFQKLSQRKTNKHPDQWFLFHFFLEKKYTYLNAIIYRVWIPLHLALCSVLQRPRDLARRYIAQKHFLFQRFDSTELR